MLRPSLAHFQGVHSCIKPDVFGISFNIHIGFLLWQPGSIVNCFFCLSACLAMKTASMETVGSRARQTCGVVHRIIIIIIIIIIICMEVRSGEK